MLYLNQQEKCQDIRSIEWKWTIKIAIQASRDIPSEFYSSQIAIRTNLPMVSFGLLTRGLFYFTVMSSNTLPFLKHGTDIYYSQSWKQGPALGPCNNVKFGNVCFDAFLSDFSLRT